VVVIGAGNTAIDAARAARRLGAGSVQILYRRGQQHMAAFSFEYEQAISEGVEFCWWTQPVAIRLSDSKISALGCVRMRSTAGNSLERLAGSEFDVLCDMIIPAIGQSPLLEFLESCRGVGIEGGRVQIDRRTGQTAHPQYFAGGDCVNGGREVVDAVADGKRSALAIGRKLEAAHA
jgi:glutamate synthase (NADPH/NADH) small chain